MKTIQFSKSVKVRLCNLVPRVLSDGRKREDPGNEVADCVLGFHVTSHFPK